MSNENNKKLEDSTKKLDDALIMLNDTTNVGINILSELDSQRNQIISMKNKLVNTTNEIERSNRTLSGMIKRESLCIIS